MVAILSGHVWVDVGVFRVGWSDVERDTDRPVTVLIMVKAGAVSERAAADIAGRCHHLLLKR